MTSIEKSSPLMLQRFELKFLIPSQLIKPIQDYAETYCVADPYADEKSTHGRQRSGAADHFDDEEMKNESISEQEKSTRRRYCSGEPGRFRDEKCTTGSDCLILLS